MLRLFSAVFVVAFLLTPAAALARQAEHQHIGPGPQNVGFVKLENSCSPAVQQSIGRGMALLHSFWYEEVDREFRQVAQTDPQCAIAWWGVAMAQWQPLWQVGGPGRDALERGREAIANGLKITKATAREREYLQALANFYTDTDAIAPAARVSAYENAMARLQSRYSNDAEAAVIYALALLSSAVSQPPDKTYTRQKKAGELLQPVFRAQPDHPGVAHYIIHAYDYPPLAQGALEAARRYAAIAPDSPHALHMPSHIFTRLGLWEDVIATNRNVVTAALKHGIIGEALHGADYQVFGHLQRGEDDLARTVIDANPPMTRVPPTHTMYFAGLYGTAAMPARYAVERKQWIEAAALPEPTGFPGGRFSWAEAVIYFARALGASRTGRVDQAKHDIARLGALRQTLLENKEQYWAGQVQIQQRAAEAWLALAEDRPADALKLARGAADLEDATDKHPVTPGQIASARDLLGQMLLELNRPAEALVEFETALKAEPNRFSPLYGAARAAELAKEATRARELYRALVRVAPNSRRAEVQHARNVAGAPSNKR